MSGGPPPFATSEEYERGLEELLAKGLIPAERHFQHLLAGDYPEFHVLLARHPLWEMRRMVAECPGVTPEAALLLCGDPDVRVRSMLALKSTLHEALVVLLRDEVLRVGKDALRNDSLRLVEVSPEALAHYPWRDFLREEGAMMRLRSVLNHHDVLTEEFKSLSTNWQGTVGALLEACSLVNR